MGGSLSRKGAAGVRADALGVIAAGGVAGGARLLVEVGRLDGIAGGPEPVLDLLGEPAAAEREASVAGTGLERDRLGRVGDHALALRQERAEPAAPGEGASVAGLLVERR